MHTTIMSVVFLLSVPLHAMEEQNTDPVYTKIAIDQREFWRFKKRLDQPKNRCAQLWKDDFQTLKKNAGDELQKKKKLYPQQFEHIHIPQRSKIQKENNENMYRHTSFQLNFIDKNSGSSTQRYLVRDVNGNNRVYRDYICQNNLPKYVLKEIKDIISEKNDNQGRLELNNGSAIEWYHVDNSIKAYKDKKGEITYLAELVFCYTDFFLQKMKKELESNNITLEKMDKSDANYRQIECNVLDKEKDYDLYVALVKKYGEKLFYEKMVYALELQDQLNAIDTHTERREPFIIIDEATDQEKVSEIYGFKEKGNDNDTYYLYGALLEDNAQDAEYELHAAGRVYKFADQLAEYVAIEEDSNS